MLPLGRCPHPIFSIRAAPAGARTCRRPRGSALRCRRGAGAAAIRSRVLSAPREERSVSVAGGTSRHDVGKCWQMVTGTACTQTRPAHRNGLLRRGISERRGRDCSPVRTTRHDCRKCAVSDPPGAGGLGRRYAGETGPMIVKVGNNQKESRAHIGACRRCNAGERLMSLLVAVFNQKSEWPGKTITYGDARHEFILQDCGPISAQALLGYDTQGQLDWTDEGLREWTQRAAQAAAPVTVEPPSPSAEAAAAALYRMGGAPGDEAARLSPAPGTPTDAEVLRPPLDAHSPSSPEPPVSVQPRKKVSHTAAGAVKAASVGPAPMPASEEAMPDAAGSTASHPALAEAGSSARCSASVSPSSVCLGSSFSLAAPAAGPATGHGQGAPHRRHRSRGHQHGGRPAACCRCARRFSAVGLTP